MDNSGKINDGHLVKANSGFYSGFYDNIDSLEKNYYQVVKIALAFNTNSSCISTYYLFLDFYTEIIISKRCSF